MGRWLSRDPIEENGGVNLHCWLANDGINGFDALGERIWKCIRKVSGFPWVGNHAYLWNDKTKIPCGMSGSSGKGQAGNPDLDLGPNQAGQNCIPIAGSEGKEEEIMDDCDENALKGLWVPVIHDCHNAADKPLKKAGIKPPKLPRVGPISGPRSSSSGTPIPPSNRPRP